MFRWIVICLVLCAITFFLMTMVLNEKQLTWDVRTWDLRTLFDRQAKTDDEGEPPVTAVAAPPPRGIDSIRDAEGRISAHVVVIPEARIHPIEKIDVPAERDGVLLVLGRKVKQTPPRLTEQEEQDMKEGKLIEGKEYWLVVEADHPGDVPPDQQIRLASEKDRVYRRWDGESNLNPLQQVRVAKISYLYQKLEVGDRVSKGQTVALIRPDLALDDLHIKITKFRAAEADRNASEKTRDEARNRYDAMERSRAIAKGSVSDDDYRGGKLTWDRYTQEEKAKAESVLQADREMRGALTILGLHEIKASIDGEVSAIYRQRFEAVKNLDPILQVHNPDRLRVEGVVDHQEAQQLGLVKGSEVVVEPTEATAPRRILRGHTQEVTCVAVSRPIKASGNALIVSGSEDRSLRIWDSGTGKEQWVVTHRSPVRSVACTSRRAPYNLVLVGNADGGVRLLNLDAIDSEPALELAAGHRSAVNCVAFSPDGTYCLTGSDDRRVTLWKLEKGAGGLAASLLHVLPIVHRAPVTAVQFVDGSDKVVQFVTVSQDKSLLVWSMENERMPEKTTELDQRSGDVAVLGVHDGRVLFDQGKELRLRSLKDRTQSLGQLRNPPGAAGFSHMALFSADGQTILTTCGSENRVQLWRTPNEANRRGVELRQLVWNTGSVTCGAFDPDNKFVVTGTQDNNVLVWSMPNPAEISAQLKARVSLIEHKLDNTSNQVRIWAELESRPKWLLPGLGATIVVYPPQTGNK